MENKFELPEYYNTKKPKEEKQDLVKRKCFACGKEKDMGIIHRNLNIKRQSNEVTAFRVIFLDRNSENPEGGGSFTPNMNNNTEMNNQSNDFGMNQAQSATENESDDAEELPW